MALLQELPIAAIIHPSDLPTRVDRRRAAEIVTNHLFPVSHRTIEAWPLPVVHVNGKATLATADVLAHARAMLAAAPAVMGGRRAAKVAA